MSKLEEINIRDTDIDSGLEYLPESVGVFWCWVSERKDVKCKTLENILKPYKQDIQKWRETNKKFLDLVGELAIIQNNIQTSLKKWSEYLAPEKLKSLEKWLKAITRIRQVSKFSTFAGGGWSAIGGNPKAGGGLTMVSSVIEFYASEAEKPYGTIKEELKKAKEDWDKSDKIKPRLESLKNNYDKLVKIVKEDFTTIENPTSSEKVNKAFSEFVASELPKDIFVDNSFYGKALSYLPKKIENILPFHNRHINEEEQEKLAENFLSNWSETEKALDDLIEEVKEYKKEYKQAFEEEKTSIYQPNENWQNLHSYFASELTQAWTSLNFTYSQTKDWIDIGLQSTDANFCAWLRDAKNLTPEETLNSCNLEDLRAEFNQNQQQSLIVQQ